MGNRQSEPADRMLDILENPRKRAKMKHRLNVSGKHNYLAVIELFENAGSGDEYLKQELINRIKNAGLIFNDECESPLEEEYIKTQCSVILEDLFQKFSKMK